MKKFIEDYKVWLIITGVVLALLTVLVAGKVKELTETKDLVSEIATDVNALYEDETKVVLVEGVTMDMVVGIEEEIASVEEMTMTAETIEVLEVAATDLMYAEQMLELQNMALALLDENGVVVDDADVATVQEKADALAPDKPEWVASIQVTIDEAKKQLDEIATATQKVNSLFTDETLSAVRPDVTRNEYNAAQDSVDMIKNATSKDSLQQSLNIVDSFLTEKEKAENISNSSSKSSDNLSSSSSSESNSNNDSDSNSSSSKKDSSNSSSDSDNNSNDGSDNIEIPQFEVDYYCVQDGIYPNGDPLPSEVYELEFETEEEMRAYMDENYPGAVYGYGIVYKEV